MYWDFQQGLYPYFCSHNLKIHYKNNLNLSVGSYSYPSFGGGSYGGGIIEGGSIGSCGVQGRI